MTLSATGSQATTTSTQTFTVWPTCSVDVSTSSGTLTENAPVTITFKSDATKCDWLFHPYEPTEVNMGATGCNVSKVLRPSDVGVGKHRVALIAAVPDVIIRHCLSSYVTVTN